MIVWILILPWNRIALILEGMIVTSAKELGVLIRAERKKRKLSQKELAEQVGVSQLWISNFERGKTTAHIGLVLRTLKTLDVKLRVGDDAPKYSGPKLVDLDALVKRQ